MYVRIAAENAAKAAAAAKSAGGEPMDGVSAGAVTTNGEVKAEPDQVAPSIETSSSGANGANTSVPEAVTNVAGS